MIRGGFSELNAFVAIADARSFSVASRALDLSPSALSHAMKGLEARLGVRLLNRSTRSVALTEAGEQLLVRGRTALTDLEDAMDEASSFRARASGSIRISASESGAKPIVRHVLPGFLASYPDIRVEFVTDTRMADIVADGFDAGIRVLDDVPKDMIPVRFGADMRFSAVASPQYLAINKPPKTQHDLLKHRCIRFRFESGALYRWDFRQNDKETSVDVSGPMTLGNVNVMIEAALAGIAVTWVPTYRVAEHVAPSQLMDLLPDWSPLFPVFCLYYPSNRHTPTALRLFSDAVRTWATEQHEGR
ncbi:LysR substrate-binding domain-containing protein [Paraburkholderia sediminicola]|uniref:LysR substrate-binding domain-containing protein n=1 Tax=Paraburkholderia sediminicola TaxID=458836 RepID=UPI0038BB5F90